MSGTAQPDMEEVHQVRIRNCVVVRRVCDNTIKFSSHICRTEIFYSREIPLWIRCEKMIVYLGHPLQSVTKTSCRFSYWICFSEIPDNRKRKSGEGISHCFKFIDPGRYVAVYIGKPVYGTYQSALDRARYILLLNTLVECS